MKDDCVVGPDDTVVVCMSGRGDKDVEEVGRRLEEVQDRPGD
jgi:tryptophan synthase beta subunit